MVSTLYIHGKHSVAPRLVLYPSLWKQAPHKDFTGENSTSQSCLLPTAAKVEMKIHPHCILLGMGLIARDCIRNCPQTPPFWKKKILESQIYNSSVYKM